MDYLDASAVVKLVVREPETRGLRAYLRGRGPSISSELVLAEVPRAIRRAGLDRPENSARALAAAERVLRGLALRRLTRGLLVEAAGFGQPRLRTLDAIHIATALDLRGAVECFVGYDRRQLDAAAAAGLPTASPGRPG